MSNVYIRSDYNRYPGTSANYDFTSGYQLPLLPDVNLFRSFSYTLYAESANSQAPPTLSSTGTNTGRQSYSQTGVRAGVAPNSTRVGYAGANIFKVPVNVEWVKTGGPDGNGVCQNEKGDWFTEEALGTPDSQGSGVRLGRIVNPGTKSVTFYTSATAAGGQTVTQTFITTVAAWPDLTISGAYNNAVFCYNKFDYTNDNVGTIYTAKSLFELPERFDNLVSFIPDERETTTLTFTIKVDWVRLVSWGAWDFLDTTTKNNLTTTLTNNGFDSAGTEYHTVTHVVNNTNDYSKILRQILDERQRPLSEQDDRYGQSFPDTQFTTETASIAYPQDSLEYVTVSGVTFATLPE